MHTLQSRNNIRREHRIIIKMIFSPHFSMVIRRNSFWSLEDNLAMYKAYCTSAGSIISPYHARRPSHKKVLYFSFYVLLCYGMIFQDSYLSPKKLLIYIKTYSHRNLSRSRKFSITALKHASNKSLKARRISVNLIKRPILNDCTRTRPSSSIFPT